jgi:hypothetical protein
MSSTTRRLPYEDRSVTNEMVSVRSYDDGGEVHDERERTTRVRTTDGGRTRTDDSHREFERGGVTSGSREHRQRSLENEIDTGNPFQPERNPFAEVAAK